MIKDQYIHHTCSLVQGLTLWISPCIMDNARKISACCLIWLLQVVKKKEVARQEIIFIGSFTFRQCTKINEDTTIDQIWWTQSTEEGKRRTYLRYRRIILRICTWNMLVYNFGRCYLSTVNHLFHPNARLLTDDAGEMHRKVSMNKLFGKMLVQPHTNYMYT